MSLSTKPYIESAADKLPSSKHVAHKVDEAAIASALSEDEDIFVNIDRRLNMLMSRANRIERALNKLYEEINQRDAIQEMDITDMGFDENLALNLDDDDEQNLDNFADIDDTSGYDGSDFLDDDPLANVEDGLVESFESKINLNVQGD